MLQSLKTNRPVILLGIFLAVCLFTFSLFSIKIFKLAGLTGISEESSLVISRLLQWLCLLILFVYVRKAEHQKLVLWRPKITSAKFYIVSFLLLIVTIFIVVIVLKKIETQYGLTEDSERLKTLLHIFRNNTPLFIFTVFTAAVVEELLFRGYLIPRLAIFFDNVYVPVIISSAFFGLVHIGFHNTSQMINTGFIGLITAIHYAKYRNIYILIIVHFAIDIIGVYTAP